jgi:hypothetical protein
MYTILVSMEKKKRDALVVVGIDFGTTYSGYGYSFQEAVYKLLLLHIQSFGIFHFRQRE